MKRRNIHKHIDNAKDQLLDTAGEIIDKTFPVVNEGISKIITGFTKSIEQSLREEVAKQIEKRKKKIASQEETKNVNS